MKHLLIILTLVIFKSGFTFAHQSELVVKNNFRGSYNLDLYSDTVKESIINIRPFHLEIVAPSSGIQFYRNGIVFLAYSRDSEKMSQKHLSFGSVMPFMALIADTLLGQYLPFLPSPSIIFPTEATTFSKDFNIMYLSLIPERDTKEKIFEAKYSPDGWVIADNPLGLCKGNYIYTHPVLSDNGSFMVFSSDMTGSSGGLDLYVSKKDGEKWGEPENLGKQINTTGNELFASLDAENNLYFSSDKLPGQGGYDIFVALYYGDGWGNPQTLPKVINTQNDEVAFTLNRNDGKSAFYTSREKSGKGKMQIYRVTLNPLINPEPSSGLSKQILALTGIPEHKQSEKSEISKSVALSEPKKTETSLTTVKEDLQTRAPQEKKTVEAPKEIKPVPDIAIVPSEKRDVLVYRIQYASNTKPVGSQKLSIAGKKYYSYEYLYKGGYRSVVGEFGKRAEASKFLNICRQTGYNQAFLVAFKNNERITDEEARILEAQTKPSEIKPETRTTDLFLVKSEGILYRVQILANTKPVGSYNISVSGKSYKTFEYLYMGGYRTTVGEFSTLEEASKLMNICRLSGYNQAFVVAFKDNVRTNDPSLFK